MAIYLTELAPGNFDFPSPYSALKEPNGLLAFGGDLNPERIYQGYQSGIFPWYGPDEPILWWSPSPRAVFDPKTFIPAKSVKKFQRKHQYTVSINHVTADVIDMCAAVRSPEETWLNEEMRQAYTQLARAGKCHSVEVWHQDALIGGLYGIEVGRLFCGESMFSLATNASKIALWYFCHHFKTNQGQLIDCQVMNPHLKSLGAKELSRDKFMQSLLSLKEQRVTESCFQPQWLTCPVEASAEE
ncbi:leucyl/phenylalanyl-tRNA--protein transferase [Vibrio fluvialis]|jgi:leucyl/phenylalanyl-tRNA--protein transferase|uniref:leucyl/phenylalanyl-tRNA--protein transferase n=1 Tax=Vibrio fluvialis TaxID=676 RepID=UPI00096B7F8F|nr:leucyl/phenylalanyl-tRNA--protein transferase [Vibrio fluvialis]EKO3366309.1 leucyl/phenylalanyl-tRNA--protein transferase [Vibrio fluvialis]EKO3370397.1 leucyl/phenylalanyl-tRNA--protein transferase [Vibrio fluvialis]EKO3498821.1 leucyl/phenylalanyl-tRNA--protein transferase [Vibrio fluvialis]EKO3502300.1 leucyl/phenylalanyl-tRNA--protein transferase [Vibrio fluvialis]EKO3547216.1 leucyl/phenylalanyl-tRNA--protein transferase [Vibrio fluvialis]